MEKQYSEIENGLPISRNYDRSTKKVIVDNALLTQLPKNKQIQVLDWIRTRIRKINTYNDRHSSYGLKHILERELNIYLTNNQFKHAMLICGYVPKDETELNWVYQISQLSPCFKQFS